MPHPCLKETLFVIKSTWSRPARANSLNVDERMGRAREERMINDAMVCYGMVWYGMVWYG